MLRTLQPLALAEGTSRKHQRYPGAFARKSELTPRSRCTPDAEMDHSAGPRAPRGYRLNRRGQAHLHGDGRATEGLALDPDIVRTMSRSKRLHARVGSARQCRQKHYQHEAPGTPSTAPSQRSERGTGVGNGNTEGGTATGLAWDDTAPRSPSPPPDWVGVRTASE